MRLLFELVARGERLRSEDRPRLNAAEVAMRNFSAGRPAEAIAGVGDKIERCRLVAQIEAGKHRGGAREAVADVPVLVAKISGKLPAVFGAALEGA